MVSWLWWCEGGKGGKDRGDERGQRRTTGGGTDFATTTVGKARWVWDRGGRFGTRRGQGAQVDDPGGRGRRRDAWRAVGSHQWSFLSAGGGPDEAEGDRPKIRLLGRCRYMGVYLSICLADSVVVVVVVKGDVEMLDVGGEAIKLGCRGKHPIRPEIRSYVSNACKPRSLRVLVRLCAWHRRVCRQTPRLSPHQPTPAHRHPINTITTTTTGTDTRPHQKQWPAAVMLVSSRGYVSIPLSRCPGVRAVLGPQCCPNAPPSSRAK